jgi:hypothetical protein
MQRNLSTRSVTRDRLEVHGEPAVSGLMGTAAQRPLSKQSDQRGSHDHRHAHVTCQLQVAPPGFEGLVVADFELVIDRRGAPHGSVLFHRNKLPNRLTVPLGIAPVWVSPATQA